MEWDQLLNTTRTRELMGSEPSTSRQTSDSRTEFRRDYDRATFSTPVRRLQDKAQVFPLEPNDAVRTRLTHSMEVSTVAWGLANDVAKGLVDDGKITPEQADSIRTIAATAGLLHDLGNPPFGHAGEDAIRTWIEALFRKHPEIRTSLEGGASQLAADFLKYEGNAQTIRLVTKLQMLADPYGLNLTCGTVSALCKYTAQSDQVEMGTGARHDRSKPGFFASETDLIKQIRGKTGTGDARNPITFLVEAADDIVYSLVDIEDGIRKGVLTWEVLCRELRANSGAAAGRVEELIGQSEKYIKDRLASSGTELHGSDLDQAYVQMFRTNGIGAHVAAAAEVFRTRYEEIMAGKYTGELVKDGSLSPFLAACKKNVGAGYVYRSKETLRLELMGRRVIHDLMDVFWEGVNQAPESDARSFGGKAYALLSRNYRAVFELAYPQAPSDAWRNYFKLLLLCDFVAGMTDTFAIRLHSQLMNG